MIFYFFFCSVFFFFYSTRELTHLPNSPLFIPEVSQKLQILPPFAGCFSLSPLFPEEVARDSEKVHPPYFSCAMMGGSGTKATMFDRRSVSGEEGEHLGGTPVLAGCFSPSRCATPLKSESPREEYRAVNTIVRRKKSILQIHSLQVCPHSSESCLQLLHIKKR